MGGTLPAVVGVPCGWQLPDVHDVPVWLLVVVVVVGGDALVVVVDDDVVGVAVAVAVAVAVTVELEELVVAGEVVPAPVEVVPAAAELVVAEEPPQPVNAAQTRIRGTAASGRTSFLTIGRSFLSAR